MKHYLDASVLMPSIVVEQTTSAIGDFLLAVAADVVISDFAGLEVASGLSRLVRMGELSPSDAAQRLADFDDWRAGSTEAAEIDATDCRVASNYVRRFDLKLRAPDALHAAICNRLGLQLVTLDRRLAAAARELGIDVVVPTE